jgi:predicted ester cyclase
MGSKADVYKAYYDKSWENPPASNIEAIKIYFSDDFKTYDKDGNVELDREKYIGVVQLIYTAFTDFTYVRSDLREDGDAVIVSGHFEGTHTGDFDLSAMGMGVIPASGKKIVWPEASNKFMIESGKIVGIQPTGDSGGMKAFLGALGVKATAV